MHYEWISSGGCEVCAALDGVHAQAPQRPHRFCVCTIVEIDPSSLPGFCLWDEPLVVGIQPGPNDISFNRTTGQFDYLIMDFAVTILCRDGTIIETAWRYEDENPDLPFSDADDSIEWAGIVADRAEEAALEYAEEHCPECEDQEEHTDDDDP